MTKQIKATKTTKNTKTAKAKADAAEFAKALEGLGRDELCAVGQVLQMLRATEAGDYKKAAVFCLAASVRRPDMALANVMMLNGFSPTLTTKPMPTQ